MINMSYCSFENTHKALLEAIEKLQSGEFDEDSEYEIEARKLLKDACQEYIDNYEEEQ